jgi:uncharacterized protein
VAAARVGETLCACAADWAVFGRPTWTLERRAQRLAVFTRLATISRVHMNRRANLRKHGIDFMDAERIFHGSTLTAEDRHDAYGERRFLAPRLLEDQVVPVAHTERGENIRIISVRKATKNEARSYFSQIVD